MHVTSAQHKNKNLLNSKMGNFFNYILHYTSNQHHGNKQFYYFHYYKGAWAINPAVFYFIKLIINPQKDMRYKMGKHHLPPFSGLYMNIYGVGVTNSSHSFKFSF